MAHAQATAHSCKPKMRFKLPEGKNGNFILKLYTKRFIKYYMQRQTDKLCVYFVSCIINIMKKHILHSCVCGMASGAYSQWPSSFIHICQTKMNRKKSKMSRAGQCSRNWSLIKLNDFPKNIALVPRSFYYLYYYRIDLFAFFFYFRRFMENCK